MMTSAATLRYVFVTGGVISGLGKGTVVSSLGLLLRKAYQMSVTAIKIDPYLNEDAGLMNPNEHGEVFVLEDGSEVDLDLGTYERALGRTLSTGNNITSGKILRRLLDAERRGAYLGQTVQVVPHFAHIVQRWIETQARADLPDGGICLIELGGTVGDYESLWFVEALRQLRARFGRERVFTVHVALVPRLGPTSEHKTKPLQHSVRTLRQFGWSPDAILCRADTVLSDPVCAKIAIACDVPTSSVVCIQDVTNLYSVPSMLLGNLTTRLWDQFKSSHKPHYAAFEAWQRDVAQRFTAWHEEDDHRTRFVLIGKYAHSDAYLSIKKAFEHVMHRCNRPMRLAYVNVNSVSDTETLSRQLKDGTFAGCIFAGGFDTKGIDTLLTLLQCVREYNIPTLGICLGMQLMVIEAARQIAQWPTATSEEFVSKQNMCGNERFCIIAMPEHHGKQRMGGTMRLGLRTACFTDPTQPYESKLKQAYSEAKRFIGEQQKQFRERHRHRYEVNPAHVQELEARTPLRFVAVDCDEVAVRYEIVEHATHPFYVGVQFHPEFTSSMQDPSPPILALVQAALSL